MRGFTLELCYNVMIGAECFVSLQRSAFLIEECNVLVDSEELIGDTEHLMLRHPDVVVTGFDSIFLKFPIYCL
jgi:hypothetical protein